MGSSDKNNIRAVFFLLLIIFTSYQSKAQLPPTPALRPAIHLTKKPNPTGPVESTHTVIPNLHFTYDGRIGLNPQPTHRDFQFNLMVPERLNTHVIEAAPGSPILRTRSWTHLNIRDAGGLFDGEVVDHASLCDATQMAQPDTAERLESNPKICAEKHKDCYDFNIIYAVGLRGGDRQLRSLPVRARVRNPKTANAVIEAIWATGDMVRGQTFTGIEKFMELNTVGPDKKLLVMRTLDSTITWRNTKTGVKKTQKRDMVYSTYRGKKGPCDVTGWREIHPITHAPHDTRINNKYGFAMMPFRDAIGNKIPDGAEIFGAYQWVDRDAKNLFFASNNVRFANWVNNRVETPFNYECQVDGCKPTNQEQVSKFEERGRGKSYAVMGLWTNGKTVQMDAMFNAADFAVGFLPKYQIKLRLYQHDSGTTNGFVRIGGQRQNQNGDSQVPGLVQNATFFGSFENSFNFLPNIAPRTPADVVWQMSSSNMTDEVAFDDYMNPNILITSPMNAASSIGGRGRRKFYDGRQFITDSIDPSMDKVFVQNASTSTDLKTPKYGEVLGSARIEPVALGGLKGKGVYLDGSDSSKIVYNVPRQKFDAENERWNYSLFVDTRFNTSQQKVRNLIEFANGSKIQLYHGNRFRFRFSGKTNEIYYHTFPQKLRANNRKWTHFGFEILPARQINRRDYDFIQSIIVYINGFPYRELTYKTNNPMGNPEGTLTVGRGLKSWIDEFKVIRGNMNFELRCNLAHGTLIRLEENYSGRYRNIASLSHGGIHAAIVSEVGEGTRNTGGRAGYVDRFACHTNYKTWKGINVNKPPANTTGVRHKILFPEGPLVHNQSRPDSADNGFCLSCHTPSHPVASMNVSALEEDAAITAEEDLRRQPMQPQRLIYGNVPANYFGSGLPRNHKRSNRNGFTVDRWVIKGN